MIRKYQKVYSANMKKVIEILRYIIYIYVGVVTDRLSPIGVDFIPYESDTRIWIWVINDTLELTFAWFQFVQYLYKCAKVY